MKQYYRAMILSAALIVPVALTAQDHRPDGNGHFEDKSHHDSHDWNDKEDQQYRRYLQEHHKKYHEFSKANKREQNNYWAWRHSHPDGQDNNHR